MADTEFTEQARIQRENVLLFVAFIGLALNILSYLDGK